MTDPDSAATLAQRLRNRAKYASELLTDEDAYVPYSEKDVALDRSAAEALERATKMEERYVSLSAIPGMGAPCLPRGGEESVSDILERLGQQANERGLAGVVEIDAYDEIKRLRAENGRLLAALKLAEDVLSRAPFSTEIWPNGMHPQRGIEIIRAALTGALDEH